MSLDLEYIEALDSNDPLADKAALFHLPGGITYLDGNSLGAMPLAVPAAVSKNLEKEWAVDLIDSWNTNDWFIRARIIGDKIAQLIGAESGEVVVGDCVSVNLFKMILAGLSMQEDKSRIVTELGNFPTNLYVMQGIEAMLGDRVELVAVERGEVESSIDKNTALVVLTHTHYKTSETWDMATLTARAQENGALVIWDLCHSAGIMPLELSGLNVDMAVGCTYKYLNGGPGAPAFLYLAGRHQGNVQQPITGWWGHASPFEFSDQYAPANDIRQLQSGTQSIVALSALEPGIDLTLSVDMQEIRKKSQALGQLFIELMAEHCPDIGIASPRDNDRRGSHVSIIHDEGYAITQALKAQGIVVDFRAPDIIRFGFAPLYNSYMDVWRSVNTLVNIINNESWKRAEYRERATVT